MSGPSVPSAALAELQVSRLDRRQKGDWPPFRKDSTGTQSSIPQSKRTPSDAPQPHNEANDQSYPSSAISISSVDIPSVDGNIEIKETEGEEEKLDLGHKKHLDAKTWSASKVMLWSLVGLVLRRRKTDGRLIMRSPGGITPYRKLSLEPQNVRMQKLYPVLS